MFSENDTLCVLELIYLTLNIEGNKFAFFQLLEVMCLIITNIF